MPHIPTETIDGIQTFHLECWSDLHSLVEQIAALQTQISFPTYIWRGQRDAGWSLSTTLDRLFERLGNLQSASHTLEASAKSLLHSFQLATRGRRGVSPPILAEQEWWALGQHFGLATPLLDWTRSPYAAAYFAFFERATGDHAADRAVYALDTEAVAEKNEEIGEGPSLETGRAPLIQVLDSVSNENARLVSQRGLFTRAPIGTPVESWVAQNFYDVREPVLIKIILPDAERIQALRALDRMNINHTSLFPDLSGASLATNLEVELFPEALRRND
jgi:hypothetical protein